MNILTSIRVTQLMSMSMLSIRIPILVRVRGRERPRHIQHSHEHGRGLTEIRRDHFCGFDFGSREEDCHRHL